MKIDQESFKRWHIPQNLSKILHPTIFMCDWYEAEECYF